jgi:hypothetical protein
MKTFRRQNNTLEKRPNRVLLGYATFHLRLRSNSPNLKRNAPLR